MFSFYYYSVSSGVLGQNVQICYTGIHVPWWLVVSITLSSTLGICPNAIPPIAPPTLNSSWCVMLPSLCPRALIVQLPLISKNMWCLVFCSCGSLLRIMVSSFIHVPAKDRNSSFLWFHSILWCICATFSLSIPSLMVIWVGSKSLLLWIVLH